MRNIFVILLLFTLQIQGKAQQFHFKQYSLEQGLSRSGVYDILQDSSGFLWVATEGGGLCKFDGENFKTYTRFNGLASEKVRVIFQDQQGIIWLGTTDGLSYFDGEDFHSLTVDDGMSNNYIRSIAQDAEGNIWVGSNLGISIIDSDEKGVSDKLSTTFSLPHKKVRSLQPQDEAMWVGTDGGLCKYNSGNIELFPDENPLSHAVILALFVDSENRLWIGTEDGLNCLTDTVLTTWTEKDGLINNRTRSITEDSKGNIWIGTSQGISVFNGSSFLNLNNVNGLSNERIRCLSVDNFNNVWIGTYFGGIMRFNHQDFIAYTPNEGLVSSQIFSITEDEKGDIIVGTYDGVSKLKIFNDKLIRTKKVTKEQGLINNSVQTVLKDENDYYWYGTSKGITLVKGNAVSYLAEYSGLKNTEITVIRKIVDTYWVGTRNGLAKIKTLDYKNFEVDFLQDTDGLAGKIVSEIGEDENGAVWVSYADASLNIFKNNQIINPILKEGVNEITSFTIDSLNQFWIGTNGNGLFYGTYDSESNEMHLENLSTINYLSSNYIFSVLIHKGQIWLGHENGLGLLTPNEDSTFNTQSYGPERGFFGLQNNQNASYVDKQGNLWFGTVNGLFCLKNDDNGSFTDGKPSINYIQSVKVNGKFIDWGKTEWCDGIDGVYGLPKNLSLPYDQNNISLEFIGLNYISPTNVKYSWKLVGFDKDWKSETTKNYTTYTNLFPGSYTFLLRSSNEHGQIIGDPIQFNFKIEKPWWSTWLVRILIILFGLGIIGLIISIRTRQLRSKQRSLEITIQERTVEIRKQKEELELKNGEITDSILYSRRIQRSILPGKEKLNNILGNHLIFYQPKDIVSGDFYWVERSLNNPKEVYFAVADCTGHGVPGAMVSLVGTRALNSSVRESRLDNVAEILEETNTIVLEAFTDVESGIIVKDGMDIALCALNYADPDKIKFQFAGAHNPAWIVRSKKLPNLVINGVELEPNISSDEDNLFEIKGNKQPIGYFEKRIPFNNNEGELLKGDRIYLNSDGYADQFGGPNGKKFKYKALKNLILDGQNKNFEIQKVIFQNNFFTWKGDLEQLDDVCLMALEV